MFNRYIRITRGNADFQLINVAVKNIDFALISIEHILNDESIDVELYGDSNTYYFFHLQSIMAACGNIYNVFFNRGIYGNTRGYNQSAYNRSVRLRNAYNISKREFSLVFEREARNTNAHFDDRYEEFDGVIGDYNVIDHQTSREKIHIIENQSHLRTFDNRTKTYITYKRDSGSFSKIYIDLNELRRQLITMRERIINNPQYNSGWEE